MSDHASATGIDSLIEHWRLVDRDDDGFYEALVAFIRRDPILAFEAGESLARLADDEVRELGLELVGRTAEVNRSFRDRALPWLRTALASDAAPGPIAAAIVFLGHLDDQESHDRILGFASHPDSLVRHAVTLAAPSVGFDQATIDVLIDLMDDEDGDVRDWATFDIAQLTDDDSPQIREALVARLDDEDDGARTEAIIGLSRRQDERVRPYLERELADPEHDEQLDDATESLDKGTDRIRYADLPD